MRLPEFFRGFARGMRIFGELIALLVNSVLLLFVYILGVGMSSIFSALAKKKLLDTDAKNKTYWENFEEKTDIDSCYRQF